MDKLSTSDKNELLYQQAQVNFNDLPSWQKRGVGFYWEEYLKPAVNPMTGEGVSATRKRIKVDLDLPMKDDYSTLMDWWIVVLFGYHPHPAPELVREISNLEHAQRIQRIWLNDDAINCALVTVHFPLSKCSD